MATLRPFRAIHPSPEKLDLEAFLHDPQAAVNLQALTHPEGDKSERSKFVRYAKSTHRLHSWLAEGFLVKTGGPAFYLVNRPGSRHLIALVQPDDQAVPLFPAPPRETTERTWLLEATNTQFEPAGAVSFKPQSLDLPAEEGFHSLTDPALIAAIQKTYQNASLTLVTQLPTFESVKESYAKKRARNPQRPIGAVLCSLQLEPFNAPLKSQHVVLKADALGPQNVQDLLLEHFDLQTTTKQELMATINHPKNKSNGTFGLSLPGGYTFAAQAKDLDRLAAELSLDSAQIGLSHNILHRYVFEKLFGTTSLDVFTYAKSSEEALDFVEAAYGTGFYLPEPEISTLEEEAIATGVFPPRSIDLASPVPTGLAMWSLNDLDA